MAPLSGHGLHVEVPSGWDGRIFRRQPSPAPAGIGTATATAAAATGEEHPVLNVANFAMPAEMGDYGGGATEAMRAGHVLINLVEFGPESVGAPLFPPVTAVPSPRAADYDPMAMQRTIAGQSGTQRFFTLAGRAFCLYVVLGSHRRRARMAPVVGDVLSTIRVD